MAPSPAGEPECGDADDDAVHGSAAESGTLELEGLLPPEPSVRGGAVVIDGVDGPSNACWRAVFAAHFLRTCGERAWEFAVGLILLALTPNTLWLVALYGLLENMAVLLLGPTVGSWLDRQASLLRGAMWTYQCQNLCNMVSASLACAALTLTDSSPHSARAARGCLIGGVMAASCMARLASAGATMCVERKWLKALCAREPQAMASISAAFRRIDLVCLFAAPILTGTLMTFASQRGAALALAAWNAATWGPQVLLLRWAAALGGMSPAAQGLLPPEPEPAPPQLALSPACTTRPAALLRECRRQLHVFWGQSMALAILPLAMLYFSVLSLGLLMTSYLKWRGISEAELSVFRGVGAVVSVAATVTFPPLNRRAGAHVAGLAGISVQLVCLVAAVVLLVPGRAAPQDDELNRGMYLMLTALMLSRWGLWTFDLSVTQLVQEGVPEEELGVTSGVQGSLQSLFELSISIVAVAVPSPKTFPWLGVASLLQVLLAFLVYIIGYLGRLRRQRPSTIPSPPDCATAGGAVRGNEQDDSLPDCQADPWMDPCALELSERPN